MGKWKHRLTDVNETNMTATCTECGRVKIRYRPEKTLVRTGLIVKRVRCAVSSQAGSGVGAFGYLPPEGQTCAICGANDNLRYDHSHETGKHRGWLCNTCNLGIGQFKDDTQLLEKAIAYLS